jgi:ADP-L-glycero-D-manno-heptose 6-epimerase
MIIVTGGAGFIGSAFIWHLNQQGIYDILVVDELGTENKWLNLSKLKFTNIIHIDELFDVLKVTKNIERVMHMGACSTTTEMDADYLMRNNVHYSMHLFNYCVERQIPFVYASSAATYGAGEHGYSDDYKTVERLVPINKYGFSKHIFDRWVLQQRELPPAWAGLKFFNVYGPQEYHKGAQASVVYHAFPQIEEKGALRLFKSYKDGIAHGDQKRDFVYVKDVVKVMYHCLYKLTPATSGIFNVGTGQARTFADLGRSVFKALKQEPKFEWIDMPPALQNQYQYFTQATGERLIKVCGYDGGFVSLEEGIMDYVLNYLRKEDRYL